MRATDEKSLRELRDTVLLLDMYDRCTQPGADLDLLWSDMTSLDPPRPCVLFSSLGQLTLYIGSLDPDSFIRKGYVCTADFRI